MDKKKNPIDEQIELEMRMTQDSIDNYRLELQRNQEKDNFSNTKPASFILSRIIDIYAEAIRQYQADYYSGRAVKCTIAAKVISLLDIEMVALISAKVILNRINKIIKIQAIYKAIGQALEDEFKMKSFKDENSSYYEHIKKDLLSRGAKANRIKNITTGVFNKRLDFHLDRWTITEKFQTGLVLVHLFVKSTGLVQFEDYFTKKRHVKYIVASDDLMKWIEDVNSKLEVMSPFFLPMVCKPKDWTSVLDGGYISPYLKRNKFIKNNDREYLRELGTAKMPIVYDSVNHIQATGWQINNKVLEVVNALWEEGRAIAELPDREDEPLIPYPYPDRGKASEESWSEDEIEVIKKWKRETYEIHKRNVAKRSNRILVSQVLRIANQFKGYEKIYFPYQMDFRGRIYPIPVLLQPQGSDLAKGLLRFSEGKQINDKTAEDWLFIHGANVYGYDKGSYKERIEWVHQHSCEIKSYAENPLLNRGWAEADKPFQFLAWCFEYSDYVNNPSTFITHIPIQLDGTCNGLQHYSALLRDEVGGSAVNLVNTERPSDIYAKTATRLEEKLYAIRNDNSHDTGSNDKLFALRWLSLGINRKLTKRPVMVLPYGGTMISCREYIGEYLKDNYSPKFIWEHFGVGESPQDCIYKMSVWLSKYLWESITETIQAATVGMAYLKGVARIVNKNKKFIEWFTPAGLLVRQAYPSRKKKEIKTELYGSILKTHVNIDDETQLDNQRQLNGICPNFIHSLDASCLMFYLMKCKKAGINSIMSVHDCYATLAPDCEKSAKFLREAFVEIYRQPILENFTEDVLLGIEVKEEDLPKMPEKGSLDIEEVLGSDYFFN